MLLKVILIGWCVMATGRAVLTNDETNVILSGLKVLRAGGCILMSDIEGGDFGATRALKAFSEQFILTGFMSKDGLEEFLKKTKPPDAITAIVIKVKKTNSVENLLVKNSKRLFWFVWFLITSDNMREEIRIPFNCQFFRVEKGFGRSFSLVEKYHLKNSSSFTNRFAFWSPENGLNAQLLNMHNRRTNFKGIQLEITFCNNFKVENEVKMFWEHSAKALNFSLKMVKLEVNKTADGDVLLQNPDGSACIWGITGSDFDSDWIFLDFGIKVKLATKFRSSNDVGWRAYVKPFKNEMWTAVGIWLLLSTVAIVVVNGPDKKSLYLNVYTSFFCLCNSDPMTVHPNGKPLPMRTKLTYLMALAVPAVLVPAYSAYVLSTLSIVLPLEPFADLKAFIADGTYRVTAVDNTFAIRYLRSSNDPDIKYINDHLFVGANTAPRGFEAMFHQLCENGKLAGLVPYTIEIRRLFRCRMFLMPQELITISTGVLLPKGSPLRKLFNERFTQYYERGTFVAKRYWRVQSQSFSEENENFRSLDISQIGTIFFLIPLGITLSLIVLTVEIFVVKYHGGISNALRLDYISE